MPAEIPRGKATTRQFGFAMPRRDQEHQAVNFAALDPLELFGNSPMKSCRLVSGIRELSEADEACLRRSA
jgi:hypothetical protein